MDGWLFHEDEAAFLLADRIAARPAEQSSDPLGEIIDFRDQLKRAGRELIFVPLPAKLAIYPEMLTGNSLSESPRRYDRAGVEFLDRLRAAGIRVVDLSPAFFAERQPAPDALFPAANSHLSSRGALVTAREVAEAIRELVEPMARPERAPITEIWAEETGDLARRLDKGDSALPDRLLLRQVPASAGLQPRHDDGRGPVLLLGDSNLLFLTDRDSGLPHLLGRELGYVTPQVTVKAGGPTGARQKLARIPYRLEGKRVVVWILAGRQLAAGPPWKRVDLPALPALLDQ